MDVDGQGEDTQDAREVKDYGLKPNFHELDEDEKEVHSSTSSDYRGPRLTCSRSFTERLGRDGTNFAREDHYHSSRD
jgi:hypothetical protein